MMMGRGQQRGPPPPGYNNDSLPPPGVGPFPRRNGSPEAHQDEMIGQAIEMDERTGSPAVNGGNHYDNHDAAGMVAMPQSNRNITPVNQQRKISGNEPVTPSSIYSES